MNSKQTQSFWDTRYKERNTGWDLNEISTPLKNYIDQLDNKDLKILIPGAGNAHEASYLNDYGFKNVTVLDIATVPLENFKKNHPNFNTKHLIQADYFNHTGQYDLIIEQTFFCSFPPTLDNRTAYVKKTADLLKPNGKLVGLLFNFPVDPDKSQPPYSGTITEYRKLFSQYFKIELLEKSYNSVPARNGKELFIKMYKK